MNETNTAKRKGKIVYNLDPELWRWARSLSIQTGFRVGEVVNFALQFMKEKRVAFVELPTTHAGNGLKIEEADNTPCSAASDSVQAACYDLDVPRYAHPPTTNPTLPARLERKK